MKTIWVAVLLGACMHSSPPLDDLDGGDVGVTLRADNTLVFPIAIDSLSRATNGCLHPSLPFLPDDVYGLSVVAEDGLPDGSTGFSLGFPGDAASHQDLDLDVQPVQILSSTLNPDGTTTIDFVQDALAGLIDIQWEQRATPALVDPTPIVAAAVRLGSLPTYEGEPMGFDVSISFTDGGLLHLRIVRPVATLSGSGCPAG